MASLFQINIHSIKAKCLTLTQYINESNPDLILINETKYSPTQTSIAINGYHTLCRHDHDATIPKQGGTAIMIKNGLQATTIDHPRFHPNSYCSAALVKLPEIGDTAIVTHYNPPNSNSINNQMFSFFLHKYNKCLFIGDYNAHNPQIAPTNHNNILGRQLHQAITNNNLIVLNDLTTHTRHSTTDQNINPSILDIALTNYALTRQIAECYTGLDIGSDHLPIHIKFKGAQVAYPTKLIRNLKKADWEIFRQQISQNLPKLPQLKNSTAHNIDTYISTLHNTIADALNVACPEKPMKPNKLNISEDTLRLIKLKRKVRRLLSRDPFCPIYKATIKSLTARIKEAIKTEKQQKWRERTSKLDYRDGAAFWKLFQQLSGANNTKPTPTLKKPDGSKTSNNQEVAHLFAEHLGRVHNIHEGPIFDDNHKQMVDKTILDNNNLFTPNFTIAPNEIISDHPHHPLSQPITPDKLRKTLSKTKNSAPGEDKIGYITLKNLPDCAITLLADLFNHLINVGHFPTPWKKALGVMIPKPNKDSQQPSNYRPISLLRCLGKLFEKSIATPLIKYLMEQQFTNKWQRAYLPHREANEHVYRLFHHMKTARHYGWKGAAILLDVEKAFDSVWHNGLKFKLLHYNLPHKIIRTLSSFLDNRTIKVKADGATSQDIHLRAGTPQGSVLSPILFNIYVNDLPFPHDGPVQISQYADDLALWTSHRGHAAWKRIRNDLQPALNQLQVWCSKWRIKINASKSQCITFPAGNPMHSFTLFNTPINFCNEAKILGLLINSTLSLIPHCTQKKQAAQRRINMLKRLRGTDWGSDIPTLLHLYKTFIRPVLETGYVATDMASKKAKNQLKIAEFKALRTALKIFYIPGERRTTNNTILEMSNLNDILTRTHTLKTLALQRYKDSPLLTELYHTLQQVRRLPFPLSKPRPELSVT